MAQGCPRILPKSLPNPKPPCSCPTPAFRRLVRNGSYFRKSDSRFIRRTRCPSCGRSSSQATGSLWSGHKKRRTHAPLFQLLVSGVSQRRSARLLGIDRKTVARKLKLLAIQARADQRRFLEELQSQGKLSLVYFDEMESSIHSKCKPVSIPLAVDSRRRILSLEVASMPAKGKLAAMARKKYGKRPDERPQAFHRFFERLQPLVHPQARFRSDQSPRYPSLVASHFPRASHERVKGQRGCIAGQGELKKIGWDPLFALNHTCAMLRANVNRLFRRTWCTSKKIEALRDHLDLYLCYHNRVLTQPS